MSFFRRPTDDSFDDESEEEECMSDSSSSGVTTNERYDQADGPGSEEAEDLDTEVQVSDLLQPLSINSIANTIRKSDRLSISNRLHSIHEDALFIESVTSRLKLPLIANERCGSWYVPPEKKSGSCYFKSTDGHFGCWSFSLRRLNLGILDIIAESGGCIIVDSTRRGKSIPDALSKTIPIWCAVMNSVLFPDIGFTIELPSNAVSASEAAQIRSLLYGFVKQLRELKLDTEKLSGILQKPMKPVWITRDSDVQKGDSTNDEYHTVYLVSASRYLRKDLQPRDSANDGQNFVYIQGAGDDHEGWARGLLPITYWEHQKQLLRTTEVELPDLIDSITSSSQPALTNNRTSEGLSILSKVQGKLAICDIATYEALIKAQAPVAGAVVLSETGSNLEQHPSSPSGIALYRAAIPSSKLGSKMLRSKLVDIASFSRPIIASDSCNSGKPLVIACDTGRDVSVGVALSLICHLFDDQGRLITSSSDTSADTPARIDKTIIRQRLGWIISERKQVNPSRATLQAVNAFLMSGPV